MAGIKRLTIRDRGILYLLYLEQNLIDKKTITGNKPVLVSLEVSDSFKLCQETKSHHA